MREPIHHARRQIQGFTNLTRRAAPAIGDDVGRHGRAVFAVAPVNFLNHTLAAIAAGQIEINVGPAFAAFAQKPLKDEMMTDRINRRDPKTITNRAVGGAAPPLHHDVVFATEIDDVPHDQEIAGKFQPSDEGQFFFQLLFHGRADGGVTLLRAEQHDGAQERIHIVTARDGKLWKFITDVLERKDQSLGQNRGVFNRFGKIAKERAHLRITF